MSFISKIFGGGGSQGGDAANAASANEDAIYKKLMMLQEQLTGFVQHADQQGLYDPERAAERFRKGFDAEHGTDLEAQATGMAHAGFKPGDSEVAYNDEKLKGRLMQDELHGAEEARHKALQEKFSAYAQTALPLGPAAQAAALSGNFGVQGGQLHDKANEGIFGQLGDIAGLIPGASPHASSAPDTGTVPTEGSLGNMPKRRGWGGFRFEGA